MGGRSDPRPGAASMGPQPASGHPPFADQAMGGPFVSTSAGVLLPAGSIGHPNGGSPGMGHPQAAEGDSSPIMAVLRRIEPILKASGAIAAFGYVASRARYNYLGLPSGTSLGVERYLMEAWALVGSRLPEFMLVAVLGTVVLAAAATLERRLGGRLHSATAARWFTTRRLALTLLLASAALTGGFYLAIAIAWPHTDIVVGSLRGKRIEEAHSSWLFYAGFASWACCLAAHRRLRRWQREYARPDPWVRAAQVWTLVTLGIFALALPLAFGRSASTGEYPIVEVRPLEAAGTSLCGLLVLETGEALHIWRAAEQRGEVMVVPREKSLLHVRELQSLVTLARRAQREGSVQPGCDGAAAGPRAGTPPRGP